MSSTCDQCGSDSYVEDFVTGDKTCANCGFIMDTYAIVNTYHLQCRDDNDPDAVSHMPKTEEQAALAPVSKLEYRTMTTKERNIHKTRRDVKALCERMVLSKKIEEEAMDLAVEYEKNRSRHGRKADDAILIGIIYLASKKVNQTIPIERLCRDAYLVDQNQVKRLYQNAVKKVLKVDEGFINIRELVPSTVEPIKYKVGNNWKYIYVTNISDMADFCETQNFGDRRPGPIAVILACTYLVIEHYNLGLTMDEMVEEYNNATFQNTATNTVKTCITSWKKNKQAILNKIK